MLENEIIEVFDKIKLKEEKKKNSVQRHYNKIFSIIFQKDMNDFNIVKEIAERIECNDIFDFLRFFSKKCLTIQRVKMLKVVEIFLEKVEVENIVSKENREFYDFLIKFKGIDFIVEDDGFYLSRKTIISEFLNHEVHLKYIKEFLDKNIEEKKIVKRVNVYYKKESFVEFLSKHFYSLDEEGELKKETLDQKEFAASDFFDFKLIAQVFDNPLRWGAWMKFNETNKIKTSFFWFEFEFGVKKIVKTKDFFIYFSKTSKVLNETFESLEKNFPNKNF